MENNWFQEELTHLEHLAKIVPDSPAVASMLSTFLTRMKANQCWTSQAIAALLGQATNIQLPEAMRKQLMETIQSLQCATGSHMKLANAGQHAQALAPYLSQTDWSKLGELQTFRLQALAQRLSKMGMANLKEATVEQALAIILMTDQWRGRPIMTPQAVHSRVEDFRTIFHSQPKSSTTGAASYPVDPHALGHAWIQQAYTPEDPPARKEVVLAPWLKKASPCLAMNFFVQLFSFHLTCLAGPIARNQQATPPSFFQDQDCGSNGGALAPNFGEVAAAAKCRAQDHVSAAQSSS